MLCTGSSVKVKQSHYRPGQAQRVLRKLRFLDFVTTAQDGGRLSATKGKSVTLRAQKVLRKLRSPDFVTTPQDGGKVVNLTHRPPLPCRKYSWYSFLLEAESTPGP